MSTRRFVPQHTGQMVCSKAGQERRADRDRQSGHFMKDSVSRRNGHVNVDTLTRLSTEEGTPNLPWRGGV